MTMRGAAHVVAPGRLDGNQEPQVDRCDEGSDQLGVVGAGGKLATGNGTGDHGLGAPESVFEEAVLRLGDLWYPGCDGG
jgi:hypothetical protein